MTLGVRLSTCHFQVSWCVSGGNGDKTKGEEKMLGAFKEKIRW